MERFEQEGVRDVLTALWCLLGRVSSTPFAWAKVIRLEGSGFIG
jgi:hypothetical protein